MLHRIAVAGSVGALLALSACGSSGGDAAPDTSELAGLWNASEPLDDGTTDERYVSISADGRYTEYDYRQDGSASDGNCYLVTAQRLRSIGTRDEQPELPGSGEDGELDPDGSLTDADVLEVTGSIPTYRLDDGRAVSFFVNYGFDSDEGFVTDEDIVIDGGSVRNALVPTFGEGRIASSNLYWPLVTGLSTEGLTPCEGI